MILNVVVAVIGVVLIYTLDDLHKIVKLVGLAFVAAFAANIPLCLSIVTSNVAGSTKRSTISVAIFAAYCVGNIVGPQFFYASQEPVYLVCVSRVRLVVFPTHIMINRAASRHPCVV
jgi:threonine/homoserine efflux transporter RhtA